MYSKGEKDELIKSLIDQSSGTIVNAKFAHGYPQYIVTSCGRVFDAVEKREVVPYISVSGYRRVWLRRRGRKSPINIYKLVATTYLGKRPSKKHVVRHLDGQSFNDHVDNLAWGTYAENSADTIKHQKERVQITEEVRDELVKSLQDCGEVVFEDLVRISQEKKVSFAALNRIYLSQKPPKS